MFSRAISEIWSWQGLPKRLVALKEKVAGFLRGEKFELARAYLTPTAVAKERSFLAPLITCLALIGLVISSIWSIAAFFNLLFALFAAYLILAHVFEIQLDVAPY